MINCICTEKLRDKNGKIIAYQLKDGNNNFTTMEARQLKFNILTKRVKVLNLKLTADGRLIDTEVNETKMTDAASTNRSMEEIRKIEDNILKLFNKMAVKCNLTKREAYEMLNLLNKVYGLKIQLIDAKYKTEDAEDFEIEASCGNMFIIVDDNTFSIINYEMSKYQGNYEELAPYEIAYINSSALETRRKRKIDIDWLRETAKFMKENQCKLDYKTLNTKLFDIMNSSVEHITKRQYMGAELEAYHSLAGDLRYGIRVKGTDRNIIDVAIKATRYGEYKPDKYVILIDNNIRRDIVYIDYNCDIEEELTKLKRMIDTRISDYIHCVDINRQRFIRDEANGLVCYRLEKMGYERYLNNHTDEDDTEFRVTLIKQGRNSTERVNLSYEAVVKALQSGKVAILGLQLCNDKIVDVRY